MMLNRVHFGFFSPVRALVDAKRSSVAQSRLLTATACSANKTVE